MNKKVSVIVPIYNKENVLYKTLESLFNQTYAKNAEFILINDGSVDKSEEICLGFIEKYGRTLKIIYKKTSNKGRSSARNLGISLSTSEYLMFLDADDQMEKNMIEEMYKNVSENSFDMGICGIKFFNENNKLLKISIPNKKMEKNFFNNLLSCAIWNKIFKTSILKENNIYFPLDVSLAEDLNFIFKFYSFTQNIKIIEKALYKYMDSNNSFIRSYKNTKDIFIMMKNINDTLNNYDKKNYNLIFRNHCIKKYTSLIMILLINELDYKKFYNEFLTEIKKFKNLISIKTKIYFYFSLLKIKVFIIFLPIIKKIKYFNKFYIKSKE